MRSVRRLAATLAAAVALTVGASGCQLTGESGGPVNCADFQLKASEAEKKTFPLTLVMLDIDDNSAAAASRVSAKMHPYLDVALREGQYIRLVGSGGETAGTSYAACFTGQRVFKIERNNDTREEKDRERALQALDTEITNFVQTTSVSETGSATSLLAGIGQEIDTVRGTPGVSTGDVTVLFWSGLLGNTKDSDCLNVAGKAASPTIAEALVRRCFSTRQISELGSEKVRFLGINDHAVTKPQQDLARYLHGELCRRLSKDCA